uniref:Uncharacterized protein n=1 Tax=Alexandrium monilatum TaxID=311494 RepID=A0A7S4SEV0_9DINO|mmetsp:Transcript_55846/g.166091  ORF Transcript_55846/g.166091 Transcript_55846/m.166091 type:complete len:766 (-) Transcript_55846:213-2510(-)
MPAAASDDFTARRFERLRSLKVVDNRFDRRFRGSRMDSFFKVSERNSNLTTEVRAGVATFLASAYIFAVNPNILSTTGLDFNGVVFATAMSSFVATMIMALWANLPFGLWPGMGMNAYFAYTVVGFKGTQHAAKKVMLAVVFSGLTFLVISILDLKRFAYKYGFPVWMMKATMAGTGCFLAFIGMQGQSGNGIDLIRSNPVTLVELTPWPWWDGHFARTMVGMLFFIVMSTLVMLRVRGAVLIGILLSACFIWILEAAEVPEFVYQPMCCLGSVSYPIPVKSKPETYGYYPKPGGGWYPKPTCDNAFVVPGEVVKNDGQVVWQGSSVLTHGPQAGNHTITSPGSAAVSHIGSLLFKGNSSGGDSSINGGCMDVCMAMHGGFHPSCLSADLKLVSTGCWTTMSLSAAPAAPTGTLYIDAFGEGCIGGAGRIPRTFRHPTSIVALPSVRLAGDLVEPFPGFNEAFCRNEEGGIDEQCAGNVDGGTLFAFDASDLTMENFWAPLLWFLYVDFLGSLGLLYAAADLSGLIDPAEPHNFPGAYGAFMADSIGTLVGGFLGTSPVTTYGESMVGVHEGGRTGLTAVVIAVLNLSAMFFAPLFASVPTLSTGPALIMVGTFMMEGVRDIDWSDYAQAIPSMLCILMQITTFTQYWGIIFARLLFSCMVILSLRCLVLLPHPLNRKVWRVLPGFIQRFIERQKGDGSFAVDKLFREKLAQAKGERKESVKEPDQEEKEEEEDQAAEAEVEPDRHGRDLAASASRASQKRVIVV